MTIVTSVKVQDGIMLATDSMTQIRNPEGECLKAYENAVKLFQVGGCPIGAMTYGAGNIGDKMIENLMHEYGNLAGTKEQEASEKPVYSISMGYGGLPEVGEFTEALKKVSKPKK